LDTIRLLAEKTDNLVDELWNYIMDRKLVQTSLLLLAAQKQIRKHDLFNTIMYRIYRECYTLGLPGDDNGEVQKQLEETFHLVSIISRAGEALDKYIQAHSEVSPLSEYCSYSATLPLIVLLYLYLENYAILLHGLFNFGCKSRHQA
jgi:hypothetical protein